MLVDASSESMEGSVSLEEGDDSVVVGSIDSLVATGCLANIAPS